MFAIYPSGSNLQALAEPSLGHRFESTEKVRGSRSLVSEERDDWIVAGQPIRKPLEARRGILRCCRKGPGTAKGRYHVGVATISEVEKLALDLPEQERAILAANLLDSLPATLWDEDEGVAEALRRDAELNAHPDEALSLQALESQIRRRP